MKHPWSPQEELFVLEPLATSAEERALFLENRKTYRKTVADRVNTQFENRVTGYAQLDADKVMRKFRHFNQRYEDYQKAPNHIIQVFAPLLLVHCFVFCGTLFFFF
jgi:hypothetical protein